MYSLNAVYAKQFFFCVGSAEIDKKSWGNLATCGSVGRSLCDSGCLHNPMESVLTTTTTKFASTCAKTFDSSCWCPWRDWQVAFYAVYILISYFEISNDWKENTAHNKELSNLNMASNSYKLKLYDVKSLKIFALACNKLTSAYIVYISSLVV